MKICIKNKYCINISVGRVFRLTKSMSLPKMSNVKPFVHKSKSTSDKDCKNILKKEFNQPGANIVQVYDFTYIRIGGRFITYVQYLTYFQEK